MAPQLGGYRPIEDIDDPYVQEIGKFAVEEHNKQAGQGLVFVRVVGGEQQVVAGTNYKLVVEAEDGGAANKYEVVVFDKLWESGRKLTCFNLVPDQLVGGYQPIPNIKDPHVQEIGKFAVMEHNKQTGQALMFVGVVSGEKQVAAGTNYKLVVAAEDAGATNKYEVVVYDKPWENFRELTFFNLVPEQVVKQVGGYQPIPNIKEPHVQEMAEFAVAEYNKQARKALVFVRVVSGEEQVVTGTNYKLVIEAEDAGVIQTYEAVTYDKPWEKVRELTSFNPMPEGVDVKQRSFEMTVGGYQPIRNVKVPHVQEIGKFAVEEHNKQASKALGFVRVVSGEQQVVAGTNYKLVIEAKDAGVTKTFEAVVYDKPWEKVSELTSFEPLTEQQIDRPVKRGWYSFMCSCGKI